jgi:hypothetical protein
MAAMNVRSADPTSKDDERRNVALDLAGDEGSVGDLKLGKPGQEVEKFDRPFPVTGSAPTFGQLYKRDGRAGETVETPTGTAWSTSVNARQPQRSALPVPVRATAWASARPISCRWRVPR